MSRVSSVFVSSPIKNTNIDVTAIMSITLVHFPLDCLPLSSMSTRALACQRRECSTSRMQHGCRHVQRIRRGGQERTTCARCTMHICGGKKIPIKPAAAGYDLGGQRKRESFPPEKGKGKVTHPQNFTQIST